MSEETEFNYLWKIFDRLVPLEVEENATTDSPGVTVPVRKYKLEVKLSTVIAILIGSEKDEFNIRDFTSFLNEELKNKLSKPDRPGDPNNYYETKGFPDLKDDLMMYGFIDCIYEPPPQPTQNERAVSFLRMQMIMHSRYRHVYSKKCYRFKYWLAFNKKLPTLVEFGKGIEIIDFHSTSQS